ncbi:putative inactive leucine-rich repeat receptor protein kinase [Trifolium repens]|nr:putative inactive leucine-rich repeat receptor protein kinase [Trifolium repens]
MERLTSTIWLEELRDATNCFSVDNAIGVGKMGMMYEGFMPNGQLLAVKRLFDSRLFKRQFLLETAILCKYRHKNIVPLLGFCIEGKERLLAYAYMSNGRLSKCLHPLESEVIRLKWHDRIKIALGIARGL